MIRTYFIPLLAIAGVLFGVWTVVQGSKPPTAQPPVIEPPRAPYETFVAGAGLVEASSRNIEIGSPFGAIVSAVHVQVGDAVEQGSPLFELDSRSERATLAVREAAVATAQEQVRRLEAGTRPEQLPTVRARVSEARANLEDAQAALTRLNTLASSDPRAVSAEDMDRRRFALASAQARLEQAQADLALLEAGSWERDIAVARTQLAQAQAEAELSRTEVERHIIKSPVNGRVLQANVRVGEFAPAGALQNNALMLVGTVTPLHVRVDVDENEAWRAKAGARARGFVRGNKDINTDLTFVRFEPYIIPKRSLTGESTERVDTRVLQVVYAFEPKDLPIYVGQQMDVYIEAPSGVGSARETMNTAAASQGGGAN